MLHYHVLTMLNLISEYDLTVKMFTELTHGTKIHNIAPLAPFNTFPPVSLVTETNLCQVFSMQTHPFVDS